MNDMNIDAIQAALESLGATTEPSVNGGRVWAGHEQVAATSEALVIHSVYDLDGFGDSVAKIVGKALGRDDLVVVEDSSEAVYDGRLGRSTTVSGTVLLDTPVKFTAGSCYTCHTGHRTTIQLSL